MRTTYPASSCTTQSVGYVVISLLLGVVTSTSACDREPGILVSLAAWPGGVERIRVRTTIEGNQGTDLYLSNEQTRFAVRVPVGSQGTVQIDAVGLDLMGCKLATGSLTEPVPDNLSRFVERTLVLSSLSFHICPFAPAMNFQVAGGLFSVAVGNFDNDMKLDLAVASNTDGCVYVLYGGGLGGFDRSTRIDVGKGRGLSSIAVGDFNGDTKSDLAVTNFDQHLVSVLFGNGTGSFGFPVHFTVGQNPWSVTVGNFNGDMKSDLAVANFGTNNVSVLFGNGMGNFSIASNFPVGNRPKSIAVGDFNGDMKSDLTVANYDTGNVSVLLGNGMGSFSLASNFPAGSNPTTVAVGDFNDDRKPDLAVTSAGDVTGSVAPKVTVLLGNGVGGFGSASIPLNLPASSVAVGDFNGDTKLDLAITCADGMLKNNEVHVLMGNGTGEFSLASISPVGKNPISVAVGDFNDDMKPDLAIANFTSADVSVLLNQFD